MILRASASTPVPLLSRITELLLVTTFSAVNLSISIPYRRKCRSSGYNASLNISSNSNLQGYSSTRYARNVLVRFDPTTLHTCQVLHHSGAIAVRPTTLGLTAPTSKLNFGTIRVEDTYMTYTYILGTRYRHQRTVRRGTLNATFSVSYTHLTLPTNREV